jgi:uncharacterized protein
MKPEKTHVEVRHKAVLLTSNVLYREGMSDLEKYETYRGCWRVGGPRREKVEYAFALTEGKVVEVYRIIRWLPAGTLEYKTRDPASLQREYRWEFEGEVAEELRDEYVGFYVGKGTHNPVRYRNV